MISHMVHGIALLSYFQSIRKARCTIACCSICPGHQFAGTESRLRHGSRASHTGFSAAISAVQLPSTAVDRHEPATSVHGGEDTIAAIVTGPHCACIQEQCHQQTAVPLLCISNIQAAYKSIHASAGPQGAVSIVRLSGPDAVSIAQAVFRPSGKRRQGWAPASHGRLLDACGDTIDEVCMPCMRLQCHAVPVMQNACCTTSLAVESCSLLRQ